MSDYLSHQEILNRILSMLEKGRLLSRRQGARLFDCDEDTFTNWINQLRKSGHQIRYSRSLQKYTLVKKNEQKK